MFDTNNAEPAHRNRPRIDYYAAGVPEIPLHWNVRRIAQD